MQVRKRVRRIDREGGEDREDLGIKIRVEKGVVLGVLKAGGHYVPLDEVWPAGRVESILAATGASAIVTASSLLPAVEEMRWRLPRLSDVVCLDVAEPEPPVEALDRLSVAGLWDFVAEGAVDRETAGGFVSAFTDQPFSAAEVDESGEFPYDVLEALTRAGFHATHIPEAYGGLGPDSLATAIVTGYQKALVSQLPHDFNLIKYHGTKGIVAVVVAVSWLARITIASQVWKDNGVFLGECRRNFVPCQMCFRMAVDEQQRPPVSFGENVDFSAGCPNPPSLEARQEFLRGSRRRRFGEFA